MFFADVNPPKQVRDTLKEIASLSPEVLNELESKLSAADIGSNPQVIIESIFVDVFGDVKQADVFERQIMGLAGLLRRLPYPTESSLSRIGDSCSERDWSEAERENWKSAIPSIARIVKSKIVDSTSKALLLHYDHDRLWVSATIISDIRPIFDDSREEVVAGVMSQTLKLAYNDKSGKEHDFSIVLDEQDISALKEACELALRKAKASKEAWTNKAGFPCLVFGGDSVAAE